MTSPPSPATASPSAWPRPTPATTSRQASCSLGCCATAARTSTGAIAARVNYALSRLNNTTGHYELAATYARRALQLNEETGDQWAQALCHLGLAHILLTIGDTEDAAGHLAAARALYGDRLGTVDEGYLKVDEARLALQRGDSELAVSVARDSVALLSNAAIPGELGIAQLALARALDELGDDRGAEQAYTAAIDLFRRRPGWHRERSRAPIAGTASSCAATAATRRRFASSSSPPTSPRQTSSATRGCPSTWRCRSARAGTR